MLTCFPKPHGNRLKGEGGKDVKYKSDSFLVYLYVLRERKHEQGRGRERGRERESQAGSVLSAQSLTWGSNP